MNWDWQELLRTVVPVIIAWVLGSLGIGVAVPNRVMNKEK